MIRCRNRQTRRFKESRRIKRGERIRVSAILCLIALLAQFSFPLIHVWQVAIEEASASSGLPFFQSLLGSGHGVAELVEATKEGSHNPHHFPASCPFCQIISRSRDFVVLYPFYMSFVFQLVGSFVHAIPTLNAFGPDLTGLVPRAPPYSS